MQVSKAGAFHLNHTPPAKAGAHLTLEFANTCREQLHAERERLAIFLARGALEPLQGLRGVFHNIAGVAASVGLRTAGSVASAAEDVALLMLSGKLAVTADTQGIIQRAFRELELSVAEALANPIAPGDAASARIAEPAQGSTPASRILIIDDDPLSARIIERCIQDAGMVSEHCKDPLKALSFIERNIPDLILLDLLMPGQDGFETCRQIRSKVSSDRVPIIFITRLSQVDDKVRALRDGADDYITKPFEPNELVARVRAHVRRHALQREQANRDGLTDAYNHRYLKQRLQQEVLRAAEGGLPLSLAMVDIDRFKEVNDLHGHGAGDTVLQKLVERFSGQLRKEDIVTRYGGDEIAVLLLGSDLGVAERAVGRLVAVVNAEPFILRSGQELAVTISAGVAQLGLAETGEALVQRADQALYSAKRDGRDRYLVAQPYKPL